MSQPTTCPRCHSPLAADAPEGLCPACLMAGGLASAPSPSDSAATTPWTEEKRAAAIADLAPHFPQLEIIELLGQGGMGAVYKARQKHLDRLIALKVIPPQAAKEPAFAERFAREARALARLNHPNIVTVYDFGQSDGVYFLLMEFVDGLNLRQTMKSGHLSPQEALAIVPHVCDALQYAHDHGIVHRDVKPENVLLDKSGRVKIADFGLAKLLTQSPLDYTLTHSAQVMGTPRYMAPEQIEHPMEVDHRADIYSLGVMFYEMLTGELPMGRFATPSQKVQIDIRIDEIVMRTLEKEPGRRYQKASEVKTELASVSSSQGERHTSTAIASGVESGEHVYSAAGMSSPNLHSQSSVTRRMSLSMEDELTVAAGLDHVAGPGNGLVIAGFLGLLLCLLLVLGIVGVFVYEQNRSLGRAHSPDFAGLDVVPILAQTAAPMPMRSTPVWFLLLPVVTCTLQVPSSILLILGGRKMKRLETYGLAVLAGVVALLPTGPAWIISMPIGIWALIVLASSDVREAFRAKRGMKRSATESLRPAADSTTPLPGKPVDKWTIVNVKQQLFWPGLGLAGGGGLGLVAVLVNCLATVTIPLWMPPPSDGII
ncbi:MAG: serine/threonine protein kinase, partial [Planctomycetales bacterium]|nr:serine/threonine protein kinase [Planctomycetales bacterium]